MNGGTHGEGRAEAKAATWKDFTPVEFSPNPLVTEFITGSAGTGKTTEIRDRRAADPDGVVLAATTGIPAVNLGPEVTTIHSLLKFFDYNSLVDAYTDGRLQTNVRKLLADGMGELIVDEISMFSAPAMDILHNACKEVSQTNDRPLALTVVGDFCQLPPNGHRKRGTTPPSGDATGTASHVDHGMGQVFPTSTGIRVVPSNRSFKRVSNRTPRFWR